MLLTLPILKFILIMAAAVILMIIGVVVILDKGRNDKKGFESESRSHPKNIFKKIIPGGKTFGVEFNNRTIGYNNTLEGSSPGLDQRKKDNETSSAEEAKQILARVESVRSYLDQEKNYDQLQDSEKAIIKIFSDAKRVDGYQKLYYQVQNLKKCYFEPRGVRDILLELAGMAEYLDEDLRQDGQDGKPALLYVTVWNTLLYTLQRREKDLDEYQRKLKKNIGILEGMENGTEPSCSKKAYNEFQSELIEFKKKGDYAGVCRKYTGKAAEVNDQLKMYEKTFSAERINNAIAFCGTYSWLMGEANRWLGEWPDVQEKTPVAVTMYEQETEISPAVNRYWENLKQFSKQAQDVIQKADEWLEKQE